MLSTASELYSKISKYDNFVCERTIEKAYYLSEKAHSNQFRSSGEKYFTHPVAVAEYLIEMKLDSATIITALLHDVVEDSEVTLDEISKEFGNEISKLVDGVTKLSKLELKFGFAQAENFRKLLLASSDDIRVLLVKLADRLHNIRTIDGIKSYEKKSRICFETLEIFAPLAERLGINAIQRELEDRCFAIVKPETQDSIVRRLKLIYSKDELNIPAIAKEIETLLNQNNINCNVTGRVKSSYSIWKKMQRKNLSMDQLSDIMAFRVIVDDVSSCYKSVGILHQEYTAVMGRFKDYISAPKRNGYQSLHSSLVGPQKTKIEVQIRTSIMNEFALNGIAAHWIYKDGAKWSEGIKYKWVRELIQILEESNEPEEFLENTKLEMYNDQVFCFTPKGNLIILPKGANAVDFSYAVHSEVGNAAVGAKINNKKRLITTEIKNGDQVEILTSKNSFPDPKWIDTCITGKAKSAIRRFIRIRETKEFLQLGTALLQKEYRQQNKRMNATSLGKIINEYGLSDLDELLIEIGKGNINSRDVLNFLYPKIDNQKKELPKLQKINSQESIKIKGVVDGMAIHYAHCCHPLPGERIVGIVTTGKGITIHALDCFALEKFNDTPEMWLEVSWDAENIKFHKGSLVATLSNEPGSLADVTKIISINNGNISNIQVISRGLDFYKFNIDLEVQNINHLNQIIAAMRLSQFVESVDRGKD
ncbi:bifunctional (p)ppGpp synthetase/guanosine-3',5'-bis(diphosphate) 3'-pyrophosphohydrolase [Alphaproteobacteria bacterium]|jgi:GTP pyrophosphokinase|nr:bifunctional (p)ppGpp synthetase/guanosine-3',5'-bis(diphosphate) 3'-pyrophosphohydrolase [Alphaproteobacteria bacterium]MDC0970276.1 bifunctional (p)ppGpp synthetase/guanosine-3',5'-bis(diphosphate) 3'-pyrophosphohydrolase [Alphaproteobacteria bacterium]